MAAVSEQARARRAPRAVPKPRATARRRPTAKRRVAGGVVWITLAATLLAGIVAINVAVLRLNLRLDDVGQERARLRADIAQLSSQLASAASTARIEREAEHRLRVTPADSARTTYVKLGR